MSFKKYIDQIKSKQKVSKPIIKQTRHSLGQEFDRGEAVALKKQNRDRYVPPVDFASASNFARYGSAEEYYSEAVDRIVNFYPYDGTSVDKERFSLSSSFLENHIFNNEFPRTNGYVVFASDGWGTKIGSLDGGYGNPTTKQYISFHGGLQVKNVVDSDKFTYNLRFGHASGNCVEFWLNKSEFLPSLTEKEVVLDIWNSSSIAASKARFTVELTASTNVLNVSIASGTVHAEAQLTSIASGSLVDGNWHHVALNFSYGTSVTVDSYLDGVFQGSQDISGDINPVTGNFVAAVGALITEQTGATNVGGLGYGKLSASIDDFRFWRTTRTGKQIGIFAKQSINGGAASDSSNQDLGVYFKFNEGITQTSSIDSTVLDYSGRLNNGSFTGYTSTARNTGSAFVLSGLSDREFKDPILYSFHPLVKNYRAEKVLSGSVYDRYNNNSIYNTLPNWIIEEDASNSQELKKFTQVLSSFLDELYLEIETLPQIQTMDYYKDEVAKTKFSQIALNSRGFITNRILQDEDTLTNLLNAGDRGEFLFKLEEVKKTIYSNLYNNSSQIFKMKGTTEALRNTLRCFGVDNELINLSLYEDNSIITLDDKRELYEEKFRFVNFSTASHHDAVVYPTLSGTVGTPFISGTSGSADSIESRLANTYECQVFLPKVPEPGTNSNIDFSSATTSIFGVRGVSVTTETDEGTTVLGDDAGFVVKAVRNNLIDKKVKFVLTSSNASMTGDYTLPELETEFFDDSYDNESWNLAVTIKPVGYGLADLNNSLQTGADSYVVNFRGYNTEDQIVLNSFDLTASMHSDRGIKMLSQNRKPFYGALRDNLTGSVVLNSDVNVGFFRVWLDDLDNNELISHAKDPRNFGRTEPYKNFLPLASQFSGSYVPKINSLVLNVGTDLLSTSDASGEFSLPDLSSGSYKTVGNSYLDTVLGGLYQFGGKEFDPSSTNVFETRYFTVGKNINPENFGDLTGINILTEDDKATKSILKAKLAYFTIEKSLQYAIDQDILSFFSSIDGFNELIGDPVNKYRMEYKELKKLGTRYFSTVQTKRTIASFFEYYKWLDNSINEILINLLPASLNGSDQVYNVVESHVLERNKYQHKLPTIEFKTPDLEGTASGSNLPFEWKFFHKPLSGEERDNCLWWKYRAERNNDTFDSTVPTGALEARETIRQVVNQTQARKQASPITEKISKSKTLHGGINFTDNKKLDFYKGVLFKTTGGTNFSDIQIPSSGVKTPKDCDDDLDLVDKRKLAAQAQADGEDYKFDLVVPGNLVSQSVSTDSYVSNTYNDNNPSHIITNIHHDVFGPDSEQPLQGTFTSQRVGGFKSRKVRLTDTGDRPERFRFNLTNANSMSLENVRRQDGYDAPVDQFYKDPPVRAPVNIKNIKTTGSAVGNFDFNYEVVQTSGRSINNFDKEDRLDLPNTLASPYVSGVFDFTFFTGTSGDSVFVERFSAPGGPETFGGGLDPVNEEFSVYNTINERNQIARTALRGYITTPNAFGGYQSGSTISASFEKIQRNGRRRIRYTTGINVETSSMFDNGFVTVGIPARDFGYTWLSQSAPSGTNLVSTIGFATGADEINFFTSTLRDFEAATDYEINFAGYVTPGEFSIFGGYHYDLDGNFLVTAPINYTTVASLADNIDIYFLNVVGNGPSGWNTWRQIRSERNPITRHLKKNNIYSQKLDRVESVKEGGVLTAKDGTRLVAVEPAIANDLPVLLAADLSDDGVKNTTLFAISHNAEKQYLFDTKINDAILTPGQTTNKSAFDKFYDFYKSNYQDSINDGDVLYSKFSHQIFPLQKYGYLKSSLVRDIFEQTWTDLRSRRSLIRLYDDTPTTETFKDNDTRTAVNEMGFDLIYAGPDVTSSFALGDQVGPSVSALDTSKFSGLEAARAAQFSLAHLTQSTSGKLYVDLRSGSIPASSATTASYDLVAADNMTYGILRDPKNVLNRFIVNVPSGNTTASFDDPGIVGAVSHVYGPILEMPQTLINTSTFAPTFFREWLAPGSSSSPSYYSTHKEFSEFVKIVGKDHSLIPEYRISQHIDSVYAGEVDLQNESVSSLEITGSSESLVNIERYFDGDIQLNYNDFSNKMSPTKIPSKFRLKIDAITKLLPYKGFYPAERTVQLAEIFSSSYSASVTLTGDEPTFRTIMQPLFMPGILYNSIKAGIAMPYGIFTGSYAIATSSNAYNNERLIGDASQQFVKIPFEELLTYDKIREVGQIVDMYPHSSMSMNSTASFDSTLPPQPQLAMSNFLASTIDFCLENNGLTTAYSKEEKDLPVADSTKTYGLEISLGISVGSAGAGFPAPWSFNTARGGWGPLVSGSNRPGFDLDIGTDRLWTPGWAAGSSSIILEWNPQQTVQHTIAEIQNEVTATFANSSYSGDDFTSFVTNNISSLSESINFLGQAEVKQSEVDPKTGLPIKVIDPLGTDKNVWAVQPKWETPFLVDSDLTQASKYLWKDLLAAPAANIQFQVSFKDRVGQSSLKDFLGFPDTLSLGKMSKSTSIEEALVCIPYKILPNGNRQFFTITNEKYDGFIEQSKLTNTPNEWSALDKALDKYVFPPRFDFKRNKAVRPLGMLIKEYSLSLTEKDIEKYWQNLGPETLNKFDVTTEYVEFDIQNTDMFTQWERYPIKWHIFKVKKRAKGNYFAMTVDNPLTADFSFDSAPSFKGTKYTTEDFTYNYPYDFCSLVETAKITAEVDFVDKTEE